MYIMYLDNLGLARQNIGIDKTGILVTNQEVYNRIITKYVIKHYI